MHKEVAEVNGGPTRLEDQQLGSSDDLFIIHYSLAIERSARHRNYSPSLGRWINQDPAGYINGVNTYQFVESNPAGNVDSRGASLAKLEGMPAQLYEGGGSGGGPTYNLPPQDTGGEAGAQRVMRTERNARAFGRALDQFCPLPLPPPPSTPWWSNISGPIRISGPDMPASWFISGADSEA